MRSITSLPRTASRLRPDAVIEPSGNASIAATVSRTGVSRPTWSLEGSFARIPGANPGTKSPDLGAAGVMRKIVKWVKWLKREEARA
jgi:hypothetical protein